METRFFILESDYVVEGNLPVIRMFGKTEDGRNILVLDRHFRPYFLVEPKQDIDNLESLKEKILQIEIDGKRPTKVETIERTFLNQRHELVKVTVDLPQDIPRFRDIVKGWKDLKEEFEYNIPFSRRFLIDKGLYPVSLLEVSGEVRENQADADLTLEASSLKHIGFIDNVNIHMLAFDIEVMEEGGREKIVMVGLKDSKGFSEILALNGKGQGIQSFGDEKSLLSAFIQSVKSRNPDAIITYNGDRFGFPKLEEKAGGYKMELNLSRDQSRTEFIRRGRLTSAHVAGRVHIDLFDFVETILAPGMSTEIFTLDRVAKELLGKGKSSDWKTGEKAWKERDFEKLAEYCIKDCELTLELGRLLLPQIFEISRVVGQLPFDVSRMSYSQLVEWVLIRKAFEMGEIIPNIPKYDEIMRRRKAPPYVGGYVHPPKEGIHEDIALFDFTSLYPSITITHNISPDTLDCEDCSEGERHYVPDQNHYFCGKKRGFVTSVIENLLEKRKGIKQEMQKAKGSGYIALYNRQHAMKIIANASYGYYGYPGSRWYSRVAAIAITSWGRSYVKKVMDQARSSGYEVIYGDTDSMFIKLKGKRQALAFLDTVNRTLPETIEMDFRDIYKAGIFVLSKEGVAAKKRYALLDSKGRVLIRGLEKVRRDWSPIARKTQEAVLKAVLKDRSTKKAVRIVRETIEDIRKGRVTFRDLVIYTQLTKPLSQYEQIGPHVAAARKSMESGRTIQAGSTIEYIITKGVGSISERAVPAENARDYDPEYYINNQILPAALRVLSGIGITEEDILKGKRIEQASLSGFFRP